MAGPDGRRVVDVAAGRDRPGGRAGHRDSGRAGHRGRGRVRRGSRHGGRDREFPQTFLSGTAIVLDPAGALYAAIGAGNLTAWIHGTSNVGHAALSN